MAMISNSTCLFFLQTRIVMQHMIGGYLFFGNVSYPCHLFSYRFVTDPVTEVWTFNGTYARSNKTWAGMVLKSRDCFVHCFFTCTSPHFELYFVCFRMCFRTRGYQNCRCKDLREWECLGHMTSLRSPRRTSTFRKLYWWKNYILTEYCVHQPLG